MRTGTRPEGDTVTVRIPLRLEHGGGRKLIIAPDDSVSTRPKPAATRRSSRRSSAPTVGGAGSRTVRRSGSPTSLHRTAWRMRMSVGSYR